MGALLYQCSRTLIVNKVGSWQQSLQVGAFQSPQQKEAGGKKREEERKERKEKRELEEREDEEKKGVKEEGRTWSKGGK